MNRRQARSILSGCALMALLVAAEATHLAASEPASGGQQTIEFGLRHLPADIVGLVVAWPQRILAHRWPSVCPWMSGWMSFVRRSV